jgi:hypothetical protein
MALRAPRIAAAMSVRPTQRIAMLVVAALAGVPA